MALVPVPPPPARGMRLPTVAGCANDHCEGRGCVCSSSWSWLPHLRPLSVGGSGLPGELGAPLGCGLAGLRPRTRGWVEELASRCVCAPRLCRPLIEEPGHASGHGSQGHGGWTDAYEQSAQGRHRHIKGARLGESASDSVLVTVSSRKHTLLAGVSQPAIQRNAHLNWELTALVDTAQPVPASLRAITPKGLGGRQKSQVLSTTLDEQSFARATDRLVSSIADFKSGLEAFDPRVSPALQKAARAAKEGGGGAAALAAGTAKEEERAEVEALHERLEVYKMARHVETELPPLSRQPLIPLPKTPPRSQAIIARNASPEALRRWHPSARRDRLEELREERQSRHDDVHCKRDQMTQSSCEHYSEIVLRKQQQADVSKASQAHHHRVSTSSIGPELPQPQPHDGRAAHVWSGASQRNAATAEWLTKVTMISFMAQIRENLKMSKMTYLQRLEYANFDLPTHKRSSVASQAVNFTRLMHDNKFGARFALIQSVYKVKRGIEKARQDIGVVHATMQTWRTAGRCLVTLRGLATKVRKLQNWWRACARRLHEIRDKLSQRWERLEHAELTFEFGKLEPQKVPTKRMVAPQPRLALDDRVQLEMMSEFSRIRFLEHELRARRYFLLTRMQLWEKESRKWHAELSSFLLEKQAYQLLGVQREKPDITWLPVRPSYLPPNHLPNEAAGCPCASICLGRRGDQEILAMVRAARSNPHGGWTEIPRSQKEDQEDRAPSRSQSRRASISRPRRSSIVRSRIPRPSSQGAPFGYDARTEDLERYGVDLEAMPGGQPLSSRVEDTGGLMC